MADIEHSSSETDAPVARPRRYPEEAALWIGGVLSAGALLLWSLSSFSLAESSLTPPVSSLVTPSPTPAVPSGIRSLEAGKRVSTTIANFMGRPPDWPGAERPGEWLWHSPEHHFSPPDDAEVLPKGPDDPVRIIVQLQEEPLAPYLTRSTGERRPLTVGEKGTAQIYQDRLDAGRRQMLMAVQPQGIELAVNREYSCLFNGFAATTRAGQVEALSRLPGVRAVFPD